MQIEKSEGKIDEEDEEEEEGEAEPDLKSESVTISGDKKTKKVNKKRTKPRNNLDHVLQVI